MSRRLATRPETARCVRPSLAWGGGGGGGAGRIPVFLHHGGSQESPARCEDRGRPAPPAPNGAGGIRSVSSTGRSPPAAESPGGRSLPGDGNGGRLLG